MKRYALLFVAGVVLSLISAQGAFADGDFVWAVAMGGPGWGKGCGIAVDSSGNVYTTGRFEGTVDFDPGAGTYTLTSAGDEDIFVSKLDSRGNFVWAKSMGGTDWETAGGIAVDSAGNVYTAGTFRDTADFDPGAGTYTLTPAGEDDIFVAKLDSSGNFVWAKSMGGGSRDRGFGIAVDSAANVYTTGWFEGTADFDPGAGTYNLTSAGSVDIFVSKLDSGGNFVWAKSMGGTDWDYGQGIAVDSAGNVYTTGGFGGTADFDPGPGTYNLTSTTYYPITISYSDIFVSKLDSGGNFVWAKSMGGTVHDSGSSIAVDSGGNVCIAGEFRGTADFDPGAGTHNLTSAGDDDVFVSKLDSSGNFVWAKNMGGRGTDRVYSIAVDSAGNVYTTGEFGYEEDTADFDPGAGIYNLTSAGLPDIFVSKLDSGGNFVWAKSMGGTDWDKGFGIAVDSAGNVYTTGWFQYTADFDPGTGTYNLTSAGEVDIFVSKLTDDIDGDGLLDEVETNTGIYVDETDTGTDPNDPDSDDDHVLDGWEVDNDLDPNDDTGDNGADGDPDGDGFTNLEEYCGGSDPQDDSSMPPALEVYRTVIDGIKVTYTRPTCLARYDQLSNALLIAVWGGERGVLKVIAQEDAPLYWDDRCDVVIEAPDTYIKKVTAKGIQDQMDLYVCGQVGYVKSFILKDGYVGGTLYYGDDFGIGSDALDASKKILIRRGATTAPVLGVPYPNTSFNPARWESALTSVRAPVEPERKPFDYEDDMEDEDIKLAELAFAEVEASIETKAAYVTEVHGVKVRYSKAGCVADYNDDDGTLTVDITESDGNLLVKCSEEAYDVWGEFCDLVIIAPDTSINTMVLKGNLETQLYVAGNVAYVKNFKLKYGAVGGTDFYGPGTGLGCTSLELPNKILIQWGWTTAPLLGVSY